LLATSTSTIWLNTALISKERGKGFLTAVNIAQSGIKPFNIDYKIIYYLL